MKTVFITICMDILRRNIIETDFWEEIKNNKDTRYVFIIEQKKMDYYEKEYKAENVEFWGLDFRYARFFQKALFVFMRAAINTESVSFYANRAYVEGDITYMNRTAKLLLSKVFGGWLWYKRLLRYLFLKIPASKEVQELFDRYKPDLVVPLSLINYYFDILIVSEAKRRNIRVAGLTRSWDNLTSHGLVAVLPDTFILQNQFLKEMGEKHQDFKRDDLKIKVIGLPHYDLYKNRDPYIESKEAFFKRVGLDPSKKLILYAGSDINLSEPAVPPKFNRLIEEKKINEDVQVVYRPHPSCKVTVEEIEELEHVVLDDVFKQRRIGKLGAVLFDTKNYINYLHHADLIINSGSTLSIDGAVFDTPVICINYDDEGYDVLYWQSVNRMYDTWTHYKRLIETGGVEMVENDSELIDAINDALQDPEKNREGRKRLLELFVEPYDGKSGKRLADIIKNELKTV